MEFLQQRPLPSEWISSGRVGSTRVVFNESNQFEAAMDYMPFGEMMREHNVGGTSYQYTGQEYDKESGIHNYRARLYDSDLGRFYGMDPAEQFASPFSYAGNNPVMMTDPDGQLAWFVPMIIGGIINAAMNHKNIDNFGDALGYFAVGAATSALTAGIGNGLSTGFSSAKFGLGFSAGWGATFSEGVSLASSGMTGVTSSFIRGAAMGAASGLAGGFTMGFGNSLLGGDSFGSALSKGIENGLLGAGTGGLIGGISGGIKAVRDGRRFFDGATVQDQVLIDKHIPYVPQRGDMNCGPANCEAISQSRGGNVTQQSIRNKLGGNPNTNPLGDITVANEFSHQSGITHLTQRGGLASTNTYLYMKSGVDVNFNIKAVEGIGHSVTANRAWQRTITRINGRVVKRIFIDVMNPARGQYIRVTNNTLQNAHRFFIYK